MWLSIWCEPTARLCAAGADRLFTRMVKLYRPARNQNPLMLARVVVPLMHNGDLAELPFIGRVDRQPPRPLGAGSKHRLQPRLPVVERLLTVAPGSAIQLDLKQLPRPSWLEVKVHVRFEPTEQLAACAKMAARNLPQSRVGKQLPKGCLAQSPSELDRWSFELEGFDYLHRLSEPLTSAVPRPTRFRPSFLS